MQPEAQHTYHPKRHSHRSEPGNELHTLKVSVAPSLLSLGLDSFTSAFSVPLLPMPTSTAAGSSSHWPEELTKMAPAEEFAKSPASRGAQVTASVMGLWP